MTFDLEELNCRNKDLDVGLDTLGRNLDLFLHKTCLLVKFMCHLRKIISLSYQLFLCWDLVGWYIFESRIQQNCICIKWTSIDQDIQVGMDEGQHWQNARFIFEGCDFHALCLFIFLSYMYRKVWMLVF